MNAHRIFFRCSCGETIDKEFKEEGFTCEKCGLKVMFIYNPKLSTYELEVIDNARQHNNTTTT